MAVRKRCIRCRKYVRDDGTCQNPNCVLYVPEVTEENDTETSTDTETKTTKSTKKSK